MSFLVELPRETYPDDALDGFTVTSDFTPQNAQAMMWLSQLAYETAHRGKVDEILTAFKLKMRAFGTNDRITGLPPGSACFIVAGGRGATFVTFAGTDPLKIQAWITDFTVALEPNVLHKGFADAVETVWPVIEAAIRNRGAAEQPLFFTGHSMGAALATLAAARALQAGFRASAVYTFGGPRVGGQDFFNFYTPDLSDLTFRLVDGDDVVATVPPSLGGNFRHVGRLLHCPHGSTFAGRTLAPRDGNDPSTVQNALSTARDLIVSLARLLSFPDIDPRSLEPIAGLLPTMVRDHIPTSYFRALSITLG
jgi:triacylglycerol lipase